MKLSTWACRRVRHGSSPGTSLVSPVGCRSVTSSIPDSEILAKMDSYYDNTVENLARQPVTALTLRQMLAWGQRALRSPRQKIVSAQFVHGELPKRLARRLLDLQLLPHLVVTNPHIRRVYEAYFSTMEALRSFPPIMTLEDNERFTNLLRELTDQHAPMLDLLALGLREVQSRPLVGRRLKLDSFLENMLRSRISRRTLAEQHIFLSQPRENFIGVICTDMRVDDGIEFASQRCRQVCLETYGIAPEVMVSGDRWLQVAYIPSHFDYVLYEILKNASRAVVERHTASANVVPGSIGGLPLGSRIPPIHIRICRADDHIVIRVSDQGGGIPLALTEKIWEFGFTTVGMARNGATDGVKKEGLAFDPTFGAAWDVSQIPATSGNRFLIGGLGFGLPLARLYARYFGGDLELHSMSGYGTDAYLTIQLLNKVDWEETDTEDFTKPIPNFYPVPTPGSEHPISTH